MRTNPMLQDAVSPVVGVMLMLVVTIIIAAVVSAFAGGVGGTNSKLPTATISGTYSQTNGMTITHMGGDSVSLSAINFMTTPSDEMGPDAAKFAWIINKTIIVDPSNGKAIYNVVSGNYNTTMFKPGDTLTVTPANCLDYTTNSSAPLPDPSVNHNAQIFWTETGKADYFGTYAFDNPANVGKVFYLDMVNNAGTVITRAQITITG